MACAPGSGSSCAPVPTTPAPAVSPNLAWGKTFVASPTGGSVSALNDGTADNYWYGSMPASVTVDLTETHAVNKIKIKVPSGWSDRSETIALLGSTDGSQFTVIKAAQAYQFTAAGASTVSIDFPATSYRYIRLTVSTNSGSGEAQLGEVLVYKQLTTTPTAIVSPQGAQSSQPRLSVDGSLINFTHSPATSWSFSVFNMQGQECFSRTDLRSASRIPDGTLKNGLHVVHVQSGSYKTSSEFLFMR